jgi:abortive infection alpha-like protein
VDYNPEFMTLVPIPTELPAWVGELLQKLILPAAEDVGFIGRDIVRYYRARIQIFFFEKFKVLCEQKHITLKHVALPLLFDIIQKGTIEENEELQDLWVNLLANAADSREQVLVRTMFPDILRQISSQEARYLNEMLDLMEGETKPHLDSVSYDNLRRLRLVDADPNAMDDFMRLPRQYRQQTPESFWLTSLGEAFVKACRAPKTEET